VPLVRREPQVLVQYPAELVPQVPQALLDQLVPQAQEPQEQLVLKVPQVPAVLYQVLLVLLVRREPQDLREPQV
jgi:hypothetical protein